MPFPWPRGGGLLTHSAAKGHDVLLEWQQGQQGAEGFSAKPSARGSAAAAEALAWGAALKV